VLLDTDIGNDVDDAVALAYLLRQPKCELVGITTVTGEARKRSALAEVICHAAGRRDIPIHCGREEPLGAGPGQPDPRQYSAIEHLPHKKDRPLNTAIEFMRETIRNHPGEITLLSIGPYSNIALLFGVDPEVPYLLKGLVSMAGSFYPGAPDREWNCIVDPIATASVYAKRYAGRSKPTLPLHRSIGLDVTMKCQMSAAEVRRRFLPEPLATVLKIAEVWFKDAAEITFHDPLAAATVFHPGLCAYKRGSVVADPSTGATHFKESAQGSPDEIALSVDSNAFFEEYFSVF
jgi:purine nucleosidase